MYNVQNLQLGFGVSKEKSGKRVKYGDGVVPGQGSPDQNTPQESPKIGRAFISWVYCTKRCVLFNPSKNMNIVYLFNSDMIRIFVQTEEKCM